MKMFAKVNFIKRFSFNCTLGNFKKCVSVSHSILCKMCIRSAYSGLDLILSSHAMGAFPDWVWLLFSYAGNLFIFCTYMNFRDLKTLFLSCSNQ